MHSVLHVHVFCHLLQDNGFISDYKMIGMQICMGDHKVSRLAIQKIRSTDDIL